MSLGTVVIEPRFCGPSTSGNGGYTAGRLAEFVEGAAEVTLRSPPPIGVPLRVEAGAAGAVTLMDGATVVAEAKAAVVSVELPAPASLDEAREASRRYLGFHHHQYPSCFVCGPERPLHDGLALYPGSVSGRELVAAPWTPALDLCDESERVRPRFMWAALDCPSWYGYAAFQSEAPPILLGRLSAHVHERAHAGEACVVHGWSLVREGRKIRAASAVFDAAGKALAWAEAVWIVLKQEER